MEDEGRVYQRDSAEERKGKSQSLRGADPTFYGFEDERRDKNTDSICRLQSTGNSASQPVGTEFFQPSEWTRKWILL